MRVCIVGGSEQAVSVSQLCAIMPLESDASAELGEAEITVLSAESFGSQQAVGLALIARHTGIV